MKSFLFGILFLILVGVGGFFWLSQQSSSSGTEQSAMTEDIVRTGLLQKSTTPGVDFAHVIVSGGQSYGVTSYTVNLDEYVGKRVEAKGQNSGTTLFADSVTVLP
jgi:hypothetical protein